MCEREGDRCLLGEESSLSNALLHHHLVELQRHGKRLVELDQFTRRQRPDKTSEGTFGKADEGITVYAAVVP